MLTYIAFVAIFNVFVGMVLAQLLPPSAIFPKYASPGSRTDQSRREPNVEAPQVSGAGEELTDRGQTSTADKPESEEKKSHQAAPAFVKSWADFAQQLRDLKDRTKFCRPAQDMRLARQAAEQLRACAQVWYSQFEPCLSGEQMDEVAKALVEHAEMSDIEMFAAQIETTLTNINALDWTGKVDDVLDCLERELGLLDIQQQNVAKKGKRIKVEA